MTIACTRCGATCEGDIIVPPLAFGFKHEAGCGHGVGPLAVLPGSFKPKPQKEEFSEKSPEPKEEIKVEEVVEKFESKAERRQARRKKE